MFGRRCKGDAGNDSLCECLRSYTTWTWLPEISFQLSTLHEMSICACCVHIDFKTCADKIYAYRFQSLEWGEIKYVKTKPNNLTKLCGEWWSCSHHQRESGVLWEICFCKLQCSSLATLSSPISLLLGWGGGGGQVQGIKRLAQAYARYHIKERERWLAPAPPGPRRYPPTRITHNDGYLHQQQQMCWKGQRADKSCRLEVC